MRVTKDDAEMLGLDQAFGNKKYAIGDIYGITVFIKKKSARRAEVQCTLREQGPAGFPPGLHHPVDLVELQQADAQGRRRDDDGAGGVRGDHGAARVDHHRPQERLAQCRYARASDQARGSGPARTAAAPSRC